MPGARPRAIEQTQIDQVLPVQNNLQLDLRAPDFARRNCSGKLLANPSYVWKWLLIYRQVMATRGFEKQAPKK